MSVGVDLAYILLDRDQISIFNDAIAAGVELTNREGEFVEKIEPKIQFSYTLSMGLG